MKMLVPIAALFLIAAGDPKEAVKVELKNLEGTWTGVSEVADGKKVDDDKAKAVSLTLKTDGTWVMKDAADTWNGTFTVDPSKKPKTGSFAILTGRFKDKTTLDIYELDGDTLKFCYVVVPTGQESTKERPTKFESEAGSGRILSIMKRAKTK